MDNKSFILYTYRYDYLKKLRNGVCESPCGPLRDRKLRFCQPEHTCSLCMREPFAAHIPPDHSALSGIQAQLVGADGTILPVGGAVPFNSLINNPSPDIDLGGTPGSFVIHRPGNYFVSWWVNTDTAGAATNVAFSVVVACGQTVSASSPLPVTTLQLNGTALLTIQTVPAYVFLVNTSGDSVTLGFSPIQANMVIVEVIQECCRPPFIRQCDPRCMVNPLATLPAVPPPPPPP